MNRVPSIFANPWVLSLLLTMPVLSLAQAVATWRSRRLLLRVGQPIALIGLLPAPPRLRWLTGLLTSFAVTALLAGAAGPRWGRDPEPEVVAGRDLIVLIDMSHSMRGADAPPDRFRRAIDGVRDLMSYLRMQGGHRVGLVVFAGDAQIVCPLTHDYDHVGWKLDALSLDDPPLMLRPRAGMRSGTRLGQGLRVAIAAHDPQFAGFQDVMLISDGHDPLGNDEWEAGLAAVESSGVPVFTVGIGDPAAGVALAIPGGGERVRTRLNEYPLQEIARRTGASYLPSRIEPPRLADFFRQRIESKGSLLPIGDAPPLARARQTWFYAVAMGLFGLATLLQVRRSDLVWLRALVKRRPRTPPAERLAASLVVGFALLAASPLPPEDWERRGHEAFEAGRFDDAAALYERAGERSSEPGRIAYNAGVASFNLGRYRDAERLFRASVESGDPQRRTRALFNLGTCLLHSSSGRDAERLAEAINALARCVEVGDDEPAVREDARHNLELAKQLWRRLGNEAPPPERNPELPDSSRPPESPDRPTGGEPGSETGGINGNGAAQPVPLPGDVAKPIPTEQHAGPGGGSMTPLTDEEQLGPLPAHEARELLRKAGERIARERRTAKRLAAPSREYPDH